MEPTETPEPMYQRSNGIEVPISSLHDIHLLNVIKKLYREVKTLRKNCPDDVESLSDQEFLESGYPDLFAEFKKRGGTYDPAISLPTTGNTGTEIPS